ncbi:cilia- and flagella-associated protein 61-like isoform X2 [Belonocnema kinseyi]|uniref:cilia- and flagella-associated protein 61-like isoform X2 n=1 Tax=Belonocnema kinseyi TaxID=2817044 RepID=UPI00143CE16F|nr:cilia- and flagella-associated protein 61-like isoform X2 [Belonocnema kinseyi]
MMNTMWLGEESMYINKKKEKHPDIVSHRRTKDSDLPEIRKLIRMKTSEIFGNINCAQVFEEACLSLVQLNEKEKIVSHVSLYTFPNVPSIPRNDWICWITRHYGLENVNTGNVLFIHFLVWDTRYIGEFFDKLLNAIFSMATFCFHLMLVHPPSVVPVEVIEKHMTRVVPKWEEDTYKIQAIYITIRQRKNKKCTFRLAVEDDNDGIVRIIDREKNKLKEFYGEYYISEMLKYSDSERKIIVSETDGVITGVMIITKVIDLNLLNNVFALGPYNGLRKSGENEIKNQGNFEEVQSDYSFFQKLEENPKMLRSEASHSTKKVSERNNVFVCQCSHEKSQKIGEICPICFPGVTISKASESEEEIREDKRDEMKVVQDFVKNGIREKKNKEKVEDKQENEDKTEKVETKIGTIDENESIKDLVEEKERDEIEMENVKDIEAEKEENREKKLIEKEIVEVLFQKEEKGIQKKENEELKEESSKFFENMKVKSLSQTAFACLLISNDEDQDSGLNQLLLAQSINLQSKIRISIIADTLGHIPNRRLTIPGIEVSELMLQELNSSNYSTSSFQGKSNAFVLEIFSLQDYRDQEIGQGFLQAAFECIPSMDYCAILLPSTHHFFPFMENFVRVPLRFNKDFPMALYLAHRAVFLGNFKSREAVPYDLEENLNQLLYGILGKEAIIKDCQEAVFKLNREKECLVFFCEDILIGIAVLSFEREINFLRRHYHIDDYVSIQNVPIDGHGRLLHFVIMPIFAVCHRFFYREIMRITGMSILYYRLYERDARALTRTHPLVSCLNDMIPVEPRIKTEFKFQHYYENNLNPSMSYQEERFSLFMMTPQLSTISKPVINTKIVVVGASDCGMAFIEMLVFASRADSANFTNVTLISTNGLPYEKNRTCLEKKFIPFNGRYCHAYRQMKAGRAWFNIINGTVSAINRKQKYVTVKKLGHLTYDYLILTCGLQFQKPRLPKQKKNWNGENPTESETPINCLSINDDTDAAVCVKSLKNWTENLTTKKWIVFYGWNIECYCALNAFLEMGVKGSWITLIEPPLPGCEMHDKVFFNNSEVDIAVMNNIVESGVKILSGRDLIDWELEDNSNGGKVIKNLKIESKSETETVPCDILMSFSEKRIQLETFMAFSRAGLVFDGLLVIDSRWRTNDPFIFAAGTVTKYSRKYFADLSKLKNFNSLEVGERLAKHLKKKIEFHTQDGEIPVKSKSRKLKPLPVYQVPRCISCILPGGFYYLHVHQPGKKVQGRVAISNDIYLSGGECLVDDIMKALIKSNWNQISEEDAKNIENKFIGSSYQEEIEKNLIDFLQYFREELPMYCIPQRAREILKDFQDSPLFTDQ